MNKRIALFMGYIEDGENITHPILGTLTKKGLRLLKYHESWDQLMPVVEKINTMDWVTIYCDECKIHPALKGSFSTIDIIHEGMPLIKTVYEAVYKYIEWLSTKCENQ